MSARNYELVLEKLDETENDNYGAGIATLSVYKDGKPLTTLVPEKRLYFASQQPTSEVAIHPTLLEDLYVVYLGTSETGRAMIQVYINPLVTWVWIGTLVLFFGTILTILPERRTSKPQPAAVPAPIRLGRFEAGT